MNYTIKIPVTVSADVIGDEATVEIGSVHLRTSRTYKVSVEKEKKDGTYVTIEERENNAIKKAIKMYEIEFKDE